MEKGGSMQAYNRSQDVFGEVESSNILEHCPECGGNLFVYTQVHAGGISEKVAECKGCGYTETRK